jgi:hypothetical protein
MYGTLSEDGSVIYSYNCFWALLEQSLSSPSPTELIPYSTVSYEALPTWKARSPYWYHPATGWPSYTLGHWVPFSSPLATRKATVRLLATG